MYDIKINKQLFNENVYVSIFKNIIEHIHNNGKDGLYFKILIFTDNMDNTNIDVEYAIKECDYQINTVEKRKFYNYQCERILNDKYNNKIKDKLDIEIHLLRDLNEFRLRGDWCNLIIMDVKEEDVYKLYDEELRIRINMVCKPIYNQIAYNIIIYE